MSYTGSPPDVKAGVGHNSGTFDQAVERFEEVGFLLAKYETLCRAIKDRRLDRPSLYVLAELIQHINRETLTTWISRDVIASRADVAVKTVSNALSQLKALGYIVSERRKTPQADDRVLLHYTLSALSPEEIEAAITRTVDSLRGKRNSVVPLNVAAPTHPESSRQDGNSLSLPSPAGRQFPPQREGSSRQDGKTVPAPTGTVHESSRQDGQNSSRQDGHSNLAIKPSNYNHLTGASAPAPTCTPTREGRGYWSKAIGGADPDAERIEVRSDGTIALRGTEHADWLAKFGGDQDRLDLAVMEIHIQANSLTSPLVQARKQLARIAGQKRDGDQRYKAAAKRNEGQRSASVSGRTSILETIARINREGEK